MGIDGPLTERQAHPEQIRRRAAEALLRVEGRHELGPLRRTTLGKVDLVDRRRIRESRLESHRIDIIQTTNCWPFWRIYDYADIKDGLGLTNKGKFLNSA